MSKTSRYVNYRKSALDSLTLCFQCGAPIFEVPSRRVGSVYFCDSCIKKIIKNEKRFERS